MAGQPPQISPDGAYWWDGQAWRPMPPPAAPPITPPEPAAARPSWLPAEAEMPGHPATVAAPPMAPAAAIAENVAPPLWAASPPANGNGRALTLAGVVALILVVALAGGLVLRQVLSQQPAGTNDAGLVAASSPSPEASPSASIAAAPLTGQLGGEYCPVAHRGDSACWKGSFLNTGPGIRKLAFMFVIGAGYSNWFANHANGTLSGFYTSPGCDVDAAASEIVCGPVPPGGEVNVYLGGDVTTRGTFSYAVKFADVSGPSPVYVNQNSDGTHEIVTWSERIT
jgi:hypothetical protein